MLTCFKTLILVAASDRTRHVMQALRSTRSDDLSDQKWLATMISAASMVLMALVVMFIQRHVRRVNASPRGLFIELCREHRLKWPQRRLLWRLAQSQKLADPATLFLEPACFEIGRLTVEMRPQAEELRRLRGQLFAESHKETNHEPTGVPAIFREDDKPTAELPLSPIPPTLELPQWTMGEQTGAID
jgi:hypothetical protein